MILSALENRRSQERGVVTMATSVNPTSPIVALRTSLSSVLLATSELVSITQARAPRALLAQNAVSPQMALAPESHHQHTQVPLCTDLLQQFEDQPAIEQRDGQGLYYNGTIHECAPLTRRWSETIDAKDQRDPLKRGDERCNTYELDLVDATTNKTSHLYATPKQCIFSSISEVAATVRHAHTDCAALSEPRPLKRPTSLFAESKQTSRFAQILYDPAAKDCATQLHKEIAGANIRQRLAPATSFSVLVPLLLCGIIEERMHALLTAGSEVNSLSLPHFAATAFSNTFKNFLVGGIQGAVGASIVNAATNIHQPDDTQINARDTFLQGGIGCLVFGLAVEALAMNAVASNTSGGRVRYGFVKAIVPAIGALFGSLLYIPSQTSPKESAKEMGYALIAGSFMSIVTLPVLSFFAGKLAQACVGARETPVPTPTAQPEQRAGLPQPVEIEMNAPPGPAIPGNDAVPATPHEPVMVELAQQPPLPASTLNIRHLLETRTQAQIDTLDHRPVVSCIDEFICPISLGIMSDPVSVPSNGVSYIFDRDQIVQAIQTHPYHPITHKPMYESELFNCMARMPQLRARIENWLGAS